LIPFKPFRFKELLMSWLFSEQELALLFWGFLLCCASLGMICSSALKAAKAVSKSEIGKVAAGKAAGAVIGKVIEKVIRL
jgi:hypothetical protein